MGLCGTNPTPFAAAPSPPPAGGAATVGRGAATPCCDRLLRPICSVEHKMRKGVSVRDVYKVGKTIGTGGAFPPPPPRAQHPSYRC